MYIVTISRFTMSGGDSLARCLSEKLDIPAVSREVLAQVAHEFGISEAFLFEKLDTTKGPSVERNQYLSAVRLALAERAQKGPFVYHGLAGHFLLKGIPQILKIGIVAPLQMRAERLMREKNITLDEAVKSIQRWDERRRKWVRLLYDVEWLDPSQYDMVVNIAEISIDSICRTIVSMLGQKEFTESKGTERLIDDFVLASRVKVQLAANDRTKALDVDVEVSKETAKITGRVLVAGIFPWGGRKSVRNDLVEVAKSVPGIKKVTISLEGTAVPLE